MSEIEFKSESRAKKKTYRISLIVESIFSIPKTLYFNFRCFSFSTAIKLPVLVSYRTKLPELHKGIITFGRSPYRFMVKFGFGGSSGIIERKSLICLEGGNVHFEGKADFCAGTSLRNSGEIRFGNRFWSNKNCTIWCSKYICFGENVLLGWNIVFRDSDGHLIIDNGEPRPVTGDVIIGNHCWICSEAHVIKGGSMGNDSVLGYRSLLNKKNEISNVLLVGSPAKIVKSNINWIRGEQIN